MTWICAIFGDEPPKVIRMANTAPMVRCTPFLAPAGGARRCTTYAVLPKGPVYHGDFQQFG
jgi:hypothetical protein